MFYSIDLLKRKGGKFGIIWQAAFFPKKLTKREIFSVNVRNTCEDLISHIIQDTIGRSKFSLLLSSHLMYGQIVVYNKQITIVYREIKDNLYKFKNELKCLNYSRTIDMAPEVEVALRTLNRKQLNEVNISQEFAYFDLPAVDEFMQPVDLDFNGNTVSYDVITMKEDFRTNINLLEENDNFGLFDVNEAFSMHAEVLNKELNDLVDNLSPQQAERNGSSSSFLDVNIPLEEAIFPDVPVKNVQIQIEAPVNAIVNTEDMNILSVEPEPEVINVIEEIRQGVGRRGNANKRRLKKGLLIDDTIRLTGEEIRDNLNAHQENLGNNREATLQERIYNLKSIVPVSTLFNQPGLALLELSNENLFKSSIKSCLEGICKEVTENQSNNDMEDTILNVLVEELDQQATPSKRSRRINDLQYIPVPIIESLAIQNAQGPLPLQETFSEIEPIETGRNISNLSLNLKSIANNSDMNISKFKIARHTSLNISSEKSAQSSINSSSLELYSNTNLNDIHLFSSVDADPDIRNIVSLNPIFEDGSITGPLIIKEGGLNINDSTDEIHERGVLLRKVESFDQMVLDMLADFKKLSQQLKFKDICPLTIPRKIATIMFNKFLEGLKVRKWRCRQEKAYSDILIFNY